MKAIIGLVLSIVSWVVCPIIAAIAALLFARSSGKEIQDSGGLIDGAGFNTATRIIAWLNIGVFLVAGLVIAGLVALGAIFSGSSSPDGIAESFAPDSGVNAATGLPDGSYVMESPGVVSYGDGDCMFGNVGDGVEGLSTRDVFVYGQGPAQCPDLVSISAVYYDVVDGVATITRVE